MNQNSVVKFADRMQQLPPYLFGMINNMKTQKRNAGDDVIDLGMGNPIDPAPQRVIQQLCHVVQDPKTHRYPVASGLKNLRKEVAKFYNWDYGVSLDCENEVICTIGSKEANVAVSPGIGFGEEGEGYLRLALVENEHRIRQAIRQIRKALLNKGQ